ncbi:MAG TPA: hypothetical protein VGS41_04970, partial [Chthonomonadales bacterium]|nr:hypothetical protein [Chthonomonadales bacterium]
YSLYYVLCALVIIFGNPLLGAAAVLTYGLVHGLALMADTLAIGTRSAGAGGLLGLGRSAFFYKMSGVSLLAAGAFFAAHYIHLSV